MFQPVEALSEGLVLRSTCRGRGRAIKAPDAERITTFEGRRGRPVKKRRCLTAPLAPQLARKLQAKRLGTVAVL